ncbi:hypothetical protein BGZ94_008460 [Podila epigama]|nr:hypothetical protein BGZ94_008460 [Podila epigama]
MEAQEHGSSAQAIKDDIDILRRELSAVEEKHRQLLEEIEREEQGIAKDAIDLAPVEIPLEEKDQKRMLDILMSYRLTGATVFTEDEFNSGDLNYLDDNTSRSDRDTRKQIGIRLETFACGRYFEPYYIFLKLKIIKDQEGSADERARQLEVTKYTIPHWIPIKDLARRYLNLDMNLFTRFTSEYLQAFVQRRENINKVVQDLSSASLTLPYDALSTYIYDSGVHTSRRPGISITEKDASMSDVTLSIIHFDLLFRLFNRQLEKRKRREIKEKLALAPTTITSSGLSKLLGDHDMDLDMINDSDSEENLREENESFLKELMAIDEASSVQIHIVYKDLKSSRPTRVDVKFTGEIRSAKGKGSATTYGQQSTSKWVQAIMSEKTLIDAFEKISNGV